MKMANLNTASMFKLWMTLAILLVAGTASARADGKVFAPVLIPQRVEMPDQRALLSWKKGVETLVIESAFVGQGTDFAWVVPLPSKPEVFPATSGTLPSAVALMQPTVAKPMPEAWSLALILGGIGLVALICGWSAVGKIMRAVLIIGLVGVVAAVIGAFSNSEYAAQLVFGMGSMMLWPLRNWIQRETTMVESIFPLLVVGVLATMMIPAFSTVRSAATGGISGVGNVTIEQRLVGDHDVTLISGREGYGVVTWLNDHGFALSEEARKVATEHAAKGGWFVASRVRRDFAETKRSVPAPLAFRFATHQPLYPMRLTGAGASQPLEVELVIFGPSRAEVAGLKTRAVAPLTQGNLAAQTGWRNALQPRDSREITHPELMRWTQGAAVATWMRGTLSPAQMQEDLSVHWTEDHKASGLYAVATDDAWGQAALLGAIICFVGAMILGLVFGHGSSARKWAGTVMVIALVSSVTLRGLTTTVAVEKQKDGWFWFELRQAAQMADQAIFELPHNPSDEAVQAAFAKALVDYSTYGKKSAIEVGDGPGEAMLQKLSDGSWRVLFLDGYGQPHFWEGTDIKQRQAPR